MPVFTAIYPSQIGKWDIRESRRQWKPLTAMYGRALPFFVVQLARMTGLEILLPAAILDCCSCTLEEIIGGAATPDGTVIALHPKDQVLVLASREGLSKLVDDEMHALLSKYKSVSARYRPISSLDNLDSKIRQLLQRSPVGQQDWVSPFAKDFPWDTYYGMMRMGGREIKLVQVDYHKLRKSWWQRLPAYFALPAWDKIKRESMR